MTKTIDFRNLFIVMLLKSYIILTTSFFKCCLASEESTTEGLLLVYLVSRLIFENDLREFSTFFLLILFNIRKIHHRFVLIVCLVCRLNLEIFKRILMTKTIDFRNLFVSIILKSLCYCDNFFLLILFSTRRVDHRRFVIGLFSL